MSNLVIVFNYKFCDDHFTCSLHICMAPGWVDLRCLLVLIDVLILLVLFFILSAECVSTVETIPRFWPILPDFDLQVSTMTGNPLDFQLYDHAPYFETRHSSIVYAFFDILLVINLHTLRCFWTLSSGLGYCNK